MNSQKPKINSHHRIQTWNTNKMITFKQYISEYLKHSQVKEPNYNNIDSMFSHESEFRDFPKSYNAKTMKPLGVSKKDFRKTKKKLKNIHSRMKDNYGSDLDSDSLRKQTAQEKGWSR